MYAYPTRESVLGPAKLTMPVDRNAQLVTYQKHNAENNTFTVWTRLADGTEYQLTDADLQNLGAWHENR